MEGSSLGRGAGKYPYPDEPAVKEGLIKQIKDNKRLILLFCSSQNVDRVVSACRAAQATGRELVMDYYTAFILSFLKDTSPGIFQVLDSSRFLYWHNSHGKALRDAGRIDFFGFFKKKEAKILMAS